MLTEASTLRNKLADQLKHMGVIRKAPIEAAFRSIPRHVFLPDAELAQVYANEAVVTRRRDGVSISSSSQPSLMAQMLDQLNLEAGHSVLEIGAGTGYNAALMASIVGSAGRVVTIDIDDDIVRDARKAIDSLGYSNIHVKLADGAFGWAPLAPYDCVVVTVGAPAVPAAWALQLRDGGRLVLPLRIRGLQRVLTLERQGSVLRSRRIARCDFMMLRGQMQSPIARCTFGPDEDYALTTENDTRLMVGLVQRFLQQRPTRVELDISANLMELVTGLDLWLALHRPEFCTLWCSKPYDPSHPIPWAAQFHGLGYGTMGLVDKAGICVLSRPFPADDGPPQTDERQKLWLACFGDCDSLAQRLAECVTAWDRCGRPDYRTYVAAVSIGATNGSPNASAAQPTILETSFSFGSTRVVLKS